MVTWEGKWQKEAPFKDMPVNLYQAFLKQVEKQPESTAIVNVDGREYSYRELHDMVDVLASALHQKYGITKRTHVGVLLFNSIEFVVTYLAIIKIGAVYVSLPGKNQQPEILSLAEKADLDFVICEQRYYDWFHDHPEIKAILCDSETEEYGYKALVEGVSGDPSLAGGEADDPVILMFTSGTTSRSKGVRLTNFNVMRSVFAYIYTLDLDEKEVAIVTTPMYHITGLVCIIATLLTCGGSVCILRKVEPEKIIRCLNEHQVTFFHASPTVFVMFLEEGAKEGYPPIPSLTRFACGSGNMAPENIRRLKRWIPNADFHTVFGMTETSGAGTIFPCGAADSEYIGSSGVPMPDLKVKILDDEGNEMPDGEIGEICVNASFVLDSYYKMDSSEIIMDGGWLRTGDLGYVNSAGYLYIRDRKKDMINRGGEKIVSFDVENVLQQLPGVIEAAVVGVPDPKYMEIPVAAVRMRAGRVWDEEKMREILKTKLSKYKIPTRFKIMEEIPKTQSGKVDKRTIRKLFIEDTQEQEQ